MYAKAMGIMANNFGLISVWEAMDAGLTNSAISVLSKPGGPWVWVRRGVYCNREVWEAADEYRGRPLLQAMAASKVLRRGWVWSHDSSAHALELDILKPDEPFVHVTRPGSGNAFKRSGIARHLAAFGPDQVVEVGTFKALDRARTAVDIARERGYRHGIVVVWSALRNGVTKQQLWDAAAPMGSWPGITSVRSAIEDGDPRFDSAAEVLSWELLTEAGLGPIEPQFPMYIPPGDRVVWCDLRVGCHIFEVNSLIKVLTPEQGGVADKEARTVLFDERKRERLVRGEGLGTSAIYWEDYWGAARQRAIKRLRAEYLDTEARFGTHLPERLVRNAAEIRARWPRGAA